MKAQTLILAIFLSIFTLSFSTVAAQSGTPGVTKTQVKQQKRIRHGIKNKELTKREVIQLERQQILVQKHKRAVKADGVVTPRERVSLKAHQAKASANIYRKKHNKRDRG